MKFTTSLAALAALAAISSVASGSADGQAVSQSKHRGLARRLRSAIGAEEAQTGHYVNLQKRYSGRATFYNNEVSEGACGGYTSSSDHIVALNVAQYGNPNARSSWCGKKIQISYGGKTQTATVVDCCPTCPEGGLDMSKGLFGAFAGFDAGVFQMNWQALGAGGSNDDDDDDDDGSSSHRKTTPTHSHTPKPTSTSSSQRRTATSTSTTSSSSSSTSSSSTSSSTGSASLPSDAATETPAPNNNLAEMSAVLQGMRNMVHAQAAGQ